MIVTVRRYIQISAVETYEQEFEVPDDVHPDDAMDYLEEKNLLADADWGDYISLDDNIDNIEYEVESITGIPDDLLEEEEEEEEEGE